MTTIKERLGEFVDELRIRLLIKLAGKNTVLINGHFTPKAVVITGEFNLCVNCNFDGVEVSYSELNGPTGTTP